MNRRAYLAVIAGSVMAGTGCFSRVMGNDIETEFEHVDAKLNAENSSEVTVDGDTVIARGTIEYGSSSCGTVRLVHAEYEMSQDRLDLLIVAADDSGEARGVQTTSCGPDTEPTSPSTNGYDGSSRPNITSSAKPTRRRST